MNNCQRLVLDANNCLAIPFDKPDEFGRNEGTLVVCYPEGDYDTIDANDFDCENLRRALYGEREIGSIPADCDQAELPNGAIFYF